MKVTDNGRKSLEELNQMFDKVLVRYFPSTVKCDKTGKERDVIKTMVALVNGSTVHYGVSKWSNRGFAYSKTKGRAMAMGRAEIAFNNYKDVESPRKAHYEGADPLAYTTNVEDPSVRNIIANFLGIEALKE